ncbi:MAG: biopolymer transporter ExbD [Methylobacterium sp.]|jgi:biopolymer transport protein TolR|nr:biopolymer transporter ExbD [Methylobacterium sp.]MCZ8269476.1 biopolymer transporter ExbD [Beijerinckiaceae bacterium]MCA3634142.1 biopolymer transporter ExbD [Methylobacterium sp.]MCA3638950.1 biopolymer transporter ExbD [Methylobacterium sp.]MCA3643994.1 biopolymer transporter ExbD [Methylobacterium sp.]
MASVSMPGGKRRKGRKAAPMAELNMIPFIDVMLVLLVIFMVAAPLLTVGVPVDLPKTGAAQLNIEQKPIAVTIDERGRLFLQEKETTIERLIPEIQAIAKDGFDERIYIRGAAQVNYGRVAEVLAALKAGGYAKTALINQPQERR